MRALPLLSLCVFACGGSSSIDEGTYVAGDIVIDDGCAIFAVDEVKPMIEIAVTADQIIFDGMQSFSRNDAGFGQQSENDVDFRPGLDCLLTLTTKWDGIFMGSDAFAFSKEITYTPITGAQCNQVLPAPIPCTSSASATYTMVPAT